MQREVNRGLLVNLQHDILLFGLPEAARSCGIVHTADRRPVRMYSLCSSVCAVGGEAGGVVSDGDRGRRNHGAALVLDDSSNLGRVTGLPKCRRRKRQHHLDEADGNTTKTPAADPHGSLLNTSFHILTS